MKAPEYPIKATGTPGVSPSREIVVRFHNPMPPGRTRTSDTRFRKPSLFGLGIDFAGCVRLRRGPKMSLTSVKAAGRLTMC